MFKLKSISSTLMSKFSKLWGTRWYCRVVGGLLMRHSPPINMLSNTSPRGSSAKTSNLQTHQRRWERRTTEETGSLTIKVWIFMDWCEISGSGRFCWWVLTQSGVTDCCKFDLFPLSSAFKSIEVGLKLILLKFNEHLTWALKEPGRSRCCLVWGPDVGQKGMSSTT